MPTALHLRPLLRRCALHAAALLLAVCLLAPTAHAAPPLARPAPNASAEPINIALIEGLSGPFANTGQAVYRNLVWAAERVNARGGIKLPQGPRMLHIEPFDSKGQTEETLSALRAAVDRHITVIAQGNSSASAAALIDGINKHNAREPQRQVVFLNYSAVDPALTNENCSYWHFRFDAHTEMRMAVLMSVLRKDSGLKKLYLIGQDYSFGRSVLSQAREQLARVRPDIHIVAQELHPTARVKDFLPYAAKIKASGAQAVLTGNWGNDLTLLIKAAREVGFEGKFYTFYGNALGAPAAIGAAGIGKVIAVAEWFPNTPGAASQAFYRAYRQRFALPQDDYLHLRMQIMVEALALALERAGAQGQPLNAERIAAQLEKTDVSLAGHRARMRAADHQLQQPLAAAIMDRVGAPGVLFDTEGSGYGFRVIEQFTTEQAQRPHHCAMRRP